MSKFIEEENEKLKEYEGDIVKSMVVFDEGHHDEISLQIDFESGKFVVIKYHFRYEDE